MILVTGGTGYIGAHTVVELMLAGLEVVAVDVRRCSLRRQFLLPIGLRCFC